MYVYITSPTGSSNDNITITYTNNLGITGRIGTVTIPKNSSVGTQIRVDLQEGDIGILDVTNVTHSALGITGEFEILSVMEHFNLKLTDSGLPLNISLASIVSTIIPEGGIISLEYHSNSTSVNFRRISLRGNLINRNQ